LVLVVVLIRVLALMCDVQFFVVIKPAIIIAISIAGGALDERPNYRHNGDGPVPHHASI
jgi:hypothetical protein